MISKNVCDKDVLSKSEAADSDDLYGDVSEPEVASDSSADSWSWVAMLVVIFVVFFFGFWHVAATTADPH